MKIDLQGIDRSGWVTFKTPDGTLYHGEVVQVNAEGAIVREPEEGQVLTTKRHGMGLQTYPNNSWYLGNWEMDSRSGKGKCLYSDGSFYEGLFKNDQRHDRGRMAWQQAIYEGGWKNGRFEGAGAMTLEGQCYKGMFRNGYFQEGDRLLNPFMPEQAGSNDVKLAEKQNRLKYFYFERVSELARLDELVRKSSSHNRVPIILPSNRSQATKAAVFEQLGRRVFEFDLRKNFLIKQRGEFGAGRIETRNQLADSILEGDIMAMNLDDSDADYKHSYYPDLEGFYDEYYFPREIWDRERLERRELFEAVCGEHAEQAGKELTLKGQFSLVLWSKFRLNPDWKDDRIMDCVFKRFKPILPVVKLDIILIT